VQGSNQPHDDTGARFDGSRVVVGLLALGAVVLALVGTRHGPGVSPDSTRYIAAARNLVAGRGDVDWSLQPMTVFPPGFALTLAGAERAGLGAVDAARVLNALAYGLLVVLTYVLARRHVLRRWLAVGAAAAVAFASPLLGVFTFAWSDPVFSVIVLALVLVLERVATERAGRPATVVAAAALTSVAFLFRYTGAPLVLLAAVVVVVAAWPDGRRAALRRVVGFAAVACVVPAAVVARNLAEGSPALGPRQSSAETVGGVVDGLVTTMGRWVLNADSAAAPATSLAFVTLALVVLVGLVAARRRAREVGDALGAPRLLPLVLFVVGYLTYLAVSELLTNIDPIDDRLLCPVFAPIVVLVVTALDPLFDRVRPGSALVRVAAAALGLWLGLGLMASVHDARIYGTAGQEYTRRDGRSAQLVSAVRGLPRSARVYSNAPGELYFVTGRQPVAESPQRTFYRSRERTHDLAALRREIARTSGPVFLVWLDPVEIDERSVTPRQMRARGLGIELVAKADDGTVYRLVVD